MPIAVTAQTVVVDEIASLAVTTIEQDGDTGEYVREVRVFAASAGGEGSEKPIIFRLQLRAPTREGVEYATPPLTL